MYTLFIYKLFNRTPFKKILHEWIHQSLAGTPMQEENQEDEDAKWHQNGHCVHLTGHFHHIFWHESTPHI
jgi:hypothetical protein